MTEHSGALDGAGKRFALVASRFNELITRELVRGARDTLLRHGVDEDGVDVYWAPGAWELPQVATRVVDAGGHDAVVAVGCVIRGATPHFEYVAGGTARGLGALAREAPVPVTFGVLTTDTLEQALERAGTKAGNKGREAALSALEMCSLFDDLPR